MSMISALDNNDAYRIASVTNGGGLHIYLTDGTSTAVSAFFVVQPCSFLRNYKLYMTRIGDETTNAVTLTFPNQNQSIWYILDIKSASSPRFDYDVLDASHPIKIQLTKAAAGRTDEMVIIEINEIVSNVFELKCASNYGGISQT